MESDSNAPERGAPWERITEEEFVARVRAVKFGSSVPASASRESVLIELALATGITDEHIEAYIAGIADATTRTVARLESQRPTWRRAHPMIGQIGAALTPPVLSEIIDEVFRRAAARDAAPL